MHLERFGKPGKTLIGSDSHTPTAGGLGMLVQNMVSRMENGMSFDEVIEWGEANKLKIAHRFTVDDLTASRRGQGIFDISEVEYAVVETNGTLSVLLKQDKQPLTQETYESPKKTTDAPCVVIIDGNVIESSLEDSPVTLDEIKRKIKNDRIDIKNVLLMTVTKSKKFLTINKEK